ncbi:MAG: hypothetical protein M3Q48_01995, partial [Actinomycetota bacterium]|nr:hypothetical protein [Actinomycetota bacterium]
MAVATTAWALSGLWRHRVLLPACCVPRRRDSAASVVKALTRAAAGLGHRPIAAELVVPMATVRGWLRRARRNAEPLRQAATVAAGQYDT